MRIGSLFSGAAGLDRAVEAVFGGEVAWFSEIDPAASKVLAYRFPGVPNLGDINGMGMPLTIAVQLLPGDGAVDLLPTPTTQDGANCAGPSQFDRNTLPLNAAVTLLPTPGAADCTGGGTDPERREAGGHHLQLIDEVLGSESRWGKYAPAIARWEAVLGRPAPAPTEPNRNGKPRLNPEFSSWMMGWPAGWVTDPAIGISRNDQLRIVGNGVCPQQAHAALRYLLGVCEAVA